MTTFDDLANLVSSGLTADDSVPADNPYHIQTDDELLRFVRNTWGVSIPAVQVEPGHVAPAQAFCDAYFARTPVGVWWASRAFGGKSFLLALFGVTVSVTLAVSTNILGGSGEQSRRVLEHMDRFWNYPAAPRHLLASEPAKRETKLTNGAKIQALMASQASVRGPHPVKLLVDECDEVNIALIDAALGQPLGAKGVPPGVVLASTRQYFGGTMDTLLERTGSNPAYRLYMWGYQESLEPHGWLTRAEVDTKRSTMTDAAWRAEVENQEPNPEARAIQPEAVREMFNRDLGDYQGALHEYVEIEPPAPGASYSTGADWARKQDFTEIVTFRTDVTPVRLVAYERTGRLDWPVMIGRFNARVQRYPGAAYHDGTGIGDVVSSLFTGYAVGVLMVGKARADMLTEFIAAIERREVVSPLIRSLEAQYKFASVADVYSGGATHHLPDGIAAGALAWMGVQRRAWPLQEIRDMAEDKYNEADVSDFARSMREDTENEDGGDLQLW